PSPPPYDLRASGGAPPKAARVISRSLNVAISCVYGLELANALLPLFMSKRFTLEISQRWQTI
ncbi:MAG: hypothetical protein WBW37_10490, partial [Methyloceanibacter sp.]